jgi:hypothetical protein
MEPRRQKLTAVFAIRLSRNTASKIREAAAREDRVVGSYLRRLVERALDHADEPPAPHATA